MIKLAKEKFTNIVVHINDVLKEQRTNYSCRGCGKEMIVVKSLARKKDWHFRHLEDTLCTGARDTALHDFAVQTILNSTGIAVTNKLRIDYSEPRKEVAFHGKRSDVTVNYLGEHVHFEIFVTHDLDQEKISIYKNNKIKCIRIDLSDKLLLTADPEKIIYAVLNDYKNKTSVYWNIEYDRNVKIGGNNWGRIVLLILSAIGIGVLLKNFWRNKRSYRKW